jgi:hypothetical protein
MGCGCRGSGDAARERNYARTAQAYQGQPGEITKSYPGDPDGDWRQGLVTDPQAPPNQPAKATA